MKSKLVSGIMLTLLSIGMLTLAFDVQPAKASGTFYITSDYTFTHNVYEPIVILADSIVVDGNGYTLQGTGSETGIDLSYRSNVTIRNINIKGFSYGIWFYYSSNNAISGNNITANNYHGIFLYSSEHNLISNNLAENNGYDGIFLNYANNNLISNNTCEYNGWHGIRSGIELWNSEHNLISNNTCSSNHDRGISLSHSNHNTISYNVCENNYYHGIHLDYSSNNTISNNTCEHNGNGNGINLGYSSSNTISNNTCEHNAYNGIGLYDSSNHNSISRNNITNNVAGIVLSDSSNHNSISRNNITENTYDGIGLHGSSNNSISRNNMANNGGGVWLFDFSNHNTISGNDITANNDNGIWLDGSDYNSISGNNITATKKYNGIGLSSSSNNSISENSIANNIVNGVWLGWSSNNKFFHNNFINNGNQVSSYRSVSIWDDGYPSGGNYWSDHVMVDDFCGINQDEPGSDGIIDEPYIIDDYNRDNYPIAKPVIPATVHVDPGTLNLKSKGRWITAYIQLPEEYDPEGIDANTILLSDTIQPILDTKYDFVTNPSEYLVDHDNDGVLERMVKFDRAEVKALLSADEATLRITGEVDGAPFQGSDTIRVIGEMLTLIGPWSGAEMDAFMPVLQAFEEKTRIDVEYKMYRAEDLATLLPAQFETGTTPGDVIFMWSWWITQQAQNGHILEVTDFIDEADFMPGALDPVKVDDTLYGGTYTGKVKPGFWYRKSFFAANGLTPPNTWDEFVDLLENLASIPGVVNPIASGDFWGWPLSDVTEHFLITFGGPELHRNLIAGTVAWNSIEVRTIFQDRLIPLLSAGHFSQPIDWITVLYDWWNGDYGLYSMGSWIIGMVENPDDLGVFTLPGAEGLVFAGDYFFIPAYTEHPKEAKELFQFLASEEAQSIQVAQGGHIATNINVPFGAYPPADRQVVELMVGKELLTDLDDTIGGQFQFTFWDQMKLLWIDPTRLDDVLDALEAVAP